MVPPVKRKRSEPNVGPRHFNPLQPERLTSPIYGLTSLGKKTSAKVILEDESVKWRLAHSAVVSRKEAEQVWQEICRQSNLENK